MPFDESVLGAFKLLWHHRNGWLRLAAVPVVASMTISLIGTWTASHGAQAYLNFAIFQVLGMLPLSLFAVGWYRLVLLGPSSIASGLLVRWSKRETRYFAVFLVVTLSVMVLTFAIVLIEISSRTPFPYVAILVVAYVALRFSLVFPALALDRPYDFSRSWRITKGNGLRLFLISLAVGIVCAIALSPILIGAIVFDLGARAPLALSLIWTLVSYLLFAVQSNILALAYRHLADDPQLSAPASA